MNRYVQLTVALAMVATWRPCSAQSSMDDVRLPPSITVGPINGTYISAMKPMNITLQCLATGYPTPTYTWYRNDEPFNSPTTGQGTIVVNSTTAKAGLYKCTAANQWGTSISNVSCLTDAVAGAFPEQQVQSHFVPLGSSIVLECNPPTSVPETFSWVMKDQTNPNNPTEILQSNKVQIDPKGNLRFAYVEATDNATSGKCYQCGVYNSFLNLKTFGSDATIIVQGSSSIIPTSQPTISYQSQSPTVGLLGQSISLTCIFSGYPVPNVNWPGKVGGGSLPGGGRSQILNYGTMLTITNLQQSDEGTYTCQGSNSVGVGTATVDLSVQAVPWFSSLEVQPINRNVTDGDTVTVVCQAQGAPAPSIAWMKNGASIKPSGSKYSVSKNLTVLTITNVCKQCPDGTTDLAVIQCNTSNSHGYVLGQGYLNILSKTVIVTPPQSQQLIPGTEMTLACLATSDPSTPMTTTWLLNGKPVSYDENVYMNDAGALIINLPANTAGSGFAGTYQCVVTNGYSEANAEAYVYLTGAVTASTPWWIFIILAILILLIVGIVALIMYLHRNRGDSYPVDERERFNGNEPEKELLKQGFQDYLRPEGAVSQNPGLLSDTDPLITANSSSANKMGGSISSSLHMLSEDGGSMSDYRSANVGKFNDQGSFISSRAVSQYPPSEDNA